MRSTIDAISDLTAIRPKRIHWSDEVTKDRTVLIVPEDSRIVHQDEIDAVHEQDFRIVVTVIDSDDTANAIDTRINAVTAEILEMLLADRDCGDYAQIEGMRFAGSRPIDDRDGRISGEILELTVVYSVKMADFERKGLR